MALFGELAFEEAMGLSLAVIWTWFVFLSETTDQQIAQNCYKIQKFTKWKPGSSFRVLIHLELKQ